MARIRKAWSAITSIVGVDEMGLLVALGLIAAGFSMVWLPGAFLVPGAVLLWIWLPVRKGFVQRDAPTVARRD